MRNLVFRMNRPASTLFGVLVLLIALLPGQGWGAAELSADLPILLSADKVTYDQENGLITATGNVETSQADRTLIADSISYNQITNIVSARGNIALLEPTGEVIFAEHMEITGDLKDAIIEDIRIILSDGAKFAATGGRRSGGRITELRNAVYSPCKLCVDDPDKPPLWQVKASKIIHDQEMRRIEYSDAWLEFKGVPIAYTPYFSHPDPTVKRETGFLTPELSNSSDLGIVTKLPFFWNIARNRDATIAPVYRTREGAGLDLEYRHKMINGNLRFDGSVSQDSEEGIRGHILSEGRFDINDTWRWGFDANRSSDETYMRRYGYGGQNSLQSRLFAEGFRNRNYFTANAYSFQSMTVNSPESPLVLPSIDYNHVGQPNAFGARTELDVNLLALTRVDGTDSQRLSVRAGWQIPYIGPLGDVYRLSASLRADGYHINNFERPSAPNTYNGFAGRIWPEASLEWRYPFVRQDETISQVIEPIASFVISPYGGNPSKIPNEDSIDFEFDDTNLFSNNRFTGLDRIEGGPRVNYGLKWGVFGDGGGSTQVLFGQTWRLKADSTFGAGTGLNDNFSDFVGSVRIVPGPYFDLLYRTRLDKGDLSPNRSEVRVSAGVPAFRVFANYMDFTQQEGSEFPARRELSLSASSQINRYWRASANGIHDLADGGGLRSIGFNVTYEDECFAFSTSLSRTFYQDRDLRPSDSITFRFTFKTLGEVGAGFNVPQ